jgi:very-short-patch-repair endonuclease
VNVLVAGELVDFFWPGARVVVEVDGYEWHKSRKQFEKDRVKDTKLQLADCRVLRATQPRIEFEPLQLIADVVAMLGATRGVWASGA